MFTNFLMFTKMINTNIVAGKYTDKKGKVQIYLQVSISRKVKRYKLFKSLPCDFDDERQMMKKGHNKENLIISKTLSKIEGINIDNPDITFTTFERLYCKQDQEVSIMDYADSRLAVGAVKTLLEVFPDATFASIRHNEVELWLKHTMSTHKKSTVFRYLLLLRSLFSRAVKQKLIEENPFLEFKTQKLEAHREYLTMEELEAIERATLPATHEPYRDLLLIECYTGLRISDLKTLEWNDISEGAIRKRMVKTDSEVFVPLSKKALSIIDRQPHTDNLIFKRCLTTLPNINGHIREVCRIAGITKKITTHCGRHTFAVQSLNKRIPIEVVSKLLGHKDLKTTQIYAKVANPLIVDYMKRWDE